VDCVGVTEGELNDTQPLERKRSVPLKALLESVAAGSTDPDVLSSVAGRLSRLDRACTAEERQVIQQVSGWPRLAQIAGAIVAALDPDAQVIKARDMHGLDASVEPTEAQITKAAEALARAAVAPLASRPELRKKLLDLRAAFDQQIIDHISEDE